MQLTTEVGSKNDWGTYVATFEAATGREITVSPGDTYGKILFQHGDPFNHYGLELLGFILAMEGKETPSLLKVTIGALRKLISGKVKKVYPLGDHQRIKNGAQLYSNLQKLKKSSTPYR